jgi:hypothetical protein
MLSAASTPAPGEHPMSVSIRILEETKIDVETTRKRLGTDGKPVHYATIYRLMNRGLETPDGGRAHLEHLRVGGKLVTSVEAISRFVAATNGIDLADAEGQPAPPAARAKELDRVDRELDRAGVTISGGKGRDRKPARGRRAAVK